MNIKFLEISFEKAYQTINKARDELLLAKAKENLLLMTHPELKEGVKVKEAFIKKLINKIK
jgi:glutamine amidotransferase PdxT